MIAFVLVGLAAVIMLMQFAIAPKASRHLWLRYSFDTELAEPGETIAFTGRLVNSWFFPILYVNLYEYMPEGAAIPGKKGNCETHSLFLLPHRGFRHAVLFTLPKRGVYRSGKYYL